VQSLLDQAGVQTVPGAATAVFVGTEFDSLAGRGGKNGTPLRRTPWGDIAFQLSGEDGFAAVAKHDAEGTAPSTEVIRKFLLMSKPALILMDELLNYLNRERNRKTGLGGPRQLRRYSGSAHIFASTEELRGAITAHSDRHATTQISSKPTWSKRWLQRAFARFAHYPPAATRSINRLPLVTTRSPGTRPLSTSTVLPLASPTVIRRSSIAFSLSWSRTAQTRTASPS
jgi:hypothetical protein